MSTKLGKALVVGPIVEEIFFCGFPKQIKLCVVHPRTVLLSYLTQALCARASALPCPLHILATDKIMQAVPCKFILLSHVHRS